MTGFDPGRVRLRLQVRGNVVVAATVACERPDIARLLRGRSAAEAVALVPLIYALCGRAQGGAARAALAAARGAADEAASDADVLAEAVREHAWKLFVDWPRHLGLNPDDAMFVRLARVRGGADVELAARLAGHPAVAALRAALRGGGHDIDRRLLTRFEDRLAQVLDWLTGRPLALGMVAATGIAPGIGEARVETARGTLTHRLELDGERIGDYRIVAPTDRNFAAGGEAEQWLERVRGMAQAEAERLVGRLAMAFDPCVPWNCEVV